MHYKKKLLRRRKKKKVYSYKYIFILIPSFFFLLILYIYFYSKAFYSSKRESEAYPLLNKNFSELDISEQIKNDEERKLYIKNKTEFYLKRRVDYLKRYRVVYNESNLITFQDKLNYLMIHESPEYKSFLADKIGVHEYSKIVLGKDICVPIIKIYDSINEINFSELPDKFVLKLNHGSEMNIICNDKSKLDFKDALRKLKRWKNTDFGFSGQEFQYSFIKRKIFAETFLGDNLIDYKIFCFNGEPKFIRIRKILNDTKHTKIHNHYDNDWKLTDLESGLHGYIRDPNVIIEKPKKLKLMLKYAKLLSQEFVFLRVDLYEVNNQIYLGELTFSPTNSFVRWKNKKQSIQIANLMDINKIKKYLFNK